jgi:hypothetical protein
LLADTAGLRQTNMTFDEATQRIRVQLQRMNELYGRPVFDEWGVVYLFEDGQGRLCAYEGPRRDEFLRSFSTEVKRFGAELRQRTQEAGAFDFSRDGVGGHFDGYLALGNGLVLVCNNTVQSMAGITKDPRWLGAQVPFVEMAEAFQVHPVVPPA